MQLPARNALAASPPKGHQTDSFQLSRVYAQGWNAARGLSANTGIDPKIMADLNPYRAEPARTRWNQGFLKASE